MDLMSDNNSQDGDHQKQHVGDDGLESKKEAIFPSYDFQPIRPNSSVGLSHSALDLAGSVNSTAAKVWAASDTVPISTSSARSYGSLDSLEPSKLFAEKDRNAPEAAILSAIDRTIKTHADNLLHVMEGVSARLTHLETRTRNLENLVDDVKVSVGNSHGNTDGKLRQLENILLEVHSGVQLLKDKQDTVEVQLQLSKLQVSKVNQQPETHSTHVEPTAQPAASLPKPPASAAAPMSHTQQGLPPTSQHSLSPPSSQLSQLSSQFSPQQEPYFPPPGQSQPHPANQAPYQPPPPPTQSLHQSPYQAPPQHTRSSHLLNFNNHHQATTWRNHLTLFSFICHTLLDNHLLALPHLNNTTTVLLSYHQCTMDRVDPVQVFLLGTLLNLTRILGHLHSLETPHR